MTDPFGNAAMNTALYTNRSRAVGRELVPNRPRVRKPSRLVSHFHWIKCRTESCSFTEMLVSPVAALRMSELVQTRIGQNFASP